MMSNELFDEVGVEVKFGVLLGWIVDYLVLVGDIVDGVLGVVKCGLKMVLKWLVQYGLFDEIVVYVDEIGGVVGQNLCDYLVFLLFGKKLVIVVCDFLNLLELKVLIIIECDSEMLCELYICYEFRMWLCELDIFGIGGFVFVELGVVEVSEVVLMVVFLGVILVNYEVIFIWLEFEIWLVKIEVLEFIVFDIEMISFNLFVVCIVGILLLVKIGEVCYILVVYIVFGVFDQLLCDEVLSKLKLWLEFIVYKKVLQNVKYDQYVFVNYGIVLVGIVYDMMLQFYVIELDKGYDFGQLCSWYFDFLIIVYEDLCGKGVK